MISELGSTPRLSRNIKEIMKKKKTLYLIDGSALAYRAYFAMERSGLTNSAGMPTGACFSFTTTMFNIIAQHIPRYTSIYFNGPEKTICLDMYEKYKAKRPKTPTDLVE